MNQFGNYFSSGGGPDQRSERKALVIAFFCCLLFITSVASIRGPMRRSVRLPEKYTVNTALPPEPPTTKFYVEEPAVKELRSEYLVVPENFEKVDFGNRSYGRYQFSDVKTINLTLKDGESWIADSNHQGWFSLKDVYYTDVTGDGTEEAIVMLSHVSCDGGGSCDGGANLIYVYAGRNEKLRTLWQYETGSNAYGCGLKSMAITQKQFVLEMFGRCPRSASDLEPRKFVVKDLTFVMFEFNGHRFVEKTSEVVTAPARNVMNYKPDIRIYSPEDSLKSQKF